jgi:hypothetical protein
VMDTQLSSYLSCCTFMSPHTRVPLYLPHNSLSALLSALDIVFASVAPLWVDNIRNIQGPPAHRGYRMYLHKTEAKGGKVGSDGFHSFSVRGPAPNV